MLGKDLLDRGEILIGGLGNAANAGDRLHQRLALIDRHHLPAAAFVGQPPQAPELARR